MLVIVGLGKTSTGCIRICIARPQHDASSVQTYSSEQDARDALLDFGISQEDIEDFTKLLAEVTSDAQIKFPPLDIPQHLLLAKGFRLM
jgi:hypothetical protein